jgi:hypothetical protein
MLLLTVAAEAGSATSKARLAAAIIVAVFDTSIFRNPPLTLVSAI